jgi:hypothetical protein
MMMMTAIGVMAIPVVRADSNTGNCTVGVTVAAEASISVDSTTTLANSSTLFANYTGTTNFTYRVRTTAVGGSGSITVQAAQFSQSGGPQIGTDPFTYISTGSVGTTVSTTSISVTDATNVLTFSQDAHADNIAGTIVWTLKDDPKYKTGAYTSVMTLTISAA